MNIHFTKIIILFIILLIQNGIKGQVLVDLWRDNCICEDLLIDFECLFLKQCKLENGKCIKLPCSEIDTEQWWALAKGCVWGPYEKKCSEFKGCSFYENIEYSSQCNFKGYDCLYNSELKKYFEESLLPNCSEQLLSQCLLGKEGLCVVKNGKCQELTNFGDVDGEDERCRLAKIACHQENSSCINIIGGCKDAMYTSCSLAEEKINGKRFYICRERAVKDCIDWDPLRKPSRLAQNNLISHIIGIIINARNVNQIFQILAFYQKQ